MTSATETDNPVLFERIDKHIALVTLNRPAARNSINAAVTAQLDAIVKTVESDPELRVAILAAAPGRAFCAGADLTAIAAGRFAELVTDAGGFAGFVYATRQKPWIAAVHGFALGGGLELSLACDLIIAADTAAFGLPEPKRGLIAGAGGVYRLARAIPRAVALEMLATGSSIDAHRAYQLGLVNRVVEEPRLLEEALKMARDIAANAPISVRESLAIGRIAGERDEAELQQLTQASAARVMASDDAKEGPQAFVEKRAPVWRS